jgi:hypothetical protein
MRPGRRPALRVRTALAADAPARPCAGVRHARKTPTKGSRGGAGGSGRAAASSSASASAASFFQHKPAQQAGDRRPHPAFMAPAPSPSLQQRQQRQQGAAAPSTSAAAAAAAARESPAAPGELSLTQIDPAVLAELPAEVQREVMQALQQQRHHKPPSARPSGRAPRRGGSGAAGQHPGPHQQQPAAQQGVPGAGTTGQAASAEELREGLLGRQPAGLETVARRRLFDGEGAEAVRAAWQAALAELGPLLQEGQAQAARGEPGAGRAAGAAGPEVITIGSTQSQAEAEAQAAAGAAASPAGRLRVACEFLLQWLLARDDDLEEVARWLRAVLRQAARWPGAAGQLRGLAEAVQRHCGAKFGFRVAC